jgi:hypothetical protein
MNKVTTTQNWREILLIHPAAELFPAMEPAELQTLAEDIKANGLKTPIHTWFDKDEQEWLIDGRNRLDALSSLGYRFSRAPLNAAGVVSTTELRICEPGSRQIGARTWQHRETETCGTFGLKIIDPYILATSLNINRRHLTTEQRRELAAKLLKTNPGQSDRAIAKLVHADHKTVGAVRDALQAGGEIPQVTERTGVDGKTQPARKKSAVKEQPHEAASPDPITAPECAQEPAAEPPSAASNFSSLEPSTRQPAALSEDLVRIVMEDYPFDWALAGLKWWFAQLTISQQNLVLETLEGLIAAPSAADLAELPDDGS